MLLGAYTLMFGYVFKIQMIPDFPILLMIGLMVWMFFSRGGGDHAARIGRAVAPLRRLEPGPADLLVFHHSADAPRVLDLLELGNRKLLLYHNITPAEAWSEHAPDVAEYSPRRCPCRGRA